MWREAEEELVVLCRMHGQNLNEAMHTALVDAYNRCKEERRRTDTSL